MSKDEDEDPINRSLSGEEIVKLLPEIQIVTYSSLFKVSNIDDILYPTGAAVILYQTKKNYGHWTCIFIRNKTLCFFDSYAMMPDDPDRLKYVDEEILIQMNETHAFLAELMKNSRYKFLDYNEYRQQSKNSTTCGRHVIVRIWLRDFNNKEYNKFMHSTKYSPDELVTILTENAFNDFECDIRKIKFYK
jgi:hypothetical protein